MKWRKNIYLLNKSVESSFIEYISKIYLVQNSISELKNISKSKNDRGTRVTYEDINKG